MEGTGAILAQDVALRTTYFCGDGIVALLITTLAVCACVCTCVYVRVYADRGVCMYLSMYKWMGIQGDTKKTGTFEKPDKN